MSLNESRKTGLLRLRHLQEVNEAKCEEMAEQAPRFARLADPTSAPRAVSAFNLFQTPEPLAEQVASLFPAFGRTLEPSAGLGRLYRAVRKLSPCPVVLVDISRDCCGELYRATEGDENAQLMCGDFLEMGAERLGLFDSIVMNPPFKQGRDIKHVRHAIGLLAPRGRLVSIVANGPRQQAQLKPIASQWINLPPGSFKESATNVSAALFVYDAP